MDRQEARQAWIREIINRRCGGKIATFARAIGKDASYVSRMLYPAEKKGAKGIGEDTVDLILMAFPESPPPSSAQLQLEAVAADDIAGPLFTKERRASDDVMALQIAVEGLLVALFQKAPGAATAFLAEVKQTGKELKFSTGAGLLGRLSGIAQRVEKIEGEAFQALRRGGPAGRTKP